MVYLGTVAISCLAAYYLAFNAAVSFTFGFGLVVLAMAWVLTGSLAVAAVMRRQFLQHQDWMIRTYVVTFAFVSFRAPRSMGKGVDVPHSCWQRPSMVEETLNQFSLIERH